MIILLLAAVFVSPVVAETTPPTSGDCGAADGESNVTWLLTQNNQDNNNPTYTLTISGTGRMRDFVADSSTGYRNNQLWGVNEYYASITKIIIEDGVTHIGENAFYQICVADIDFGSIQSVGKGAFAGALKDTSQTNGKISGTYTMSLPSTLTLLAENAFCWNTGVTSIQVNGAVSSIPDGTFGNCKAVTSVVLPSTITSIGKYAFQNCERLTTINIPEGVTSLVEYSFSGCTSMVEIVLPSTLQTAPAYTFNDCSSLESVTINSDISSEKTFQNCGALKTIVFGDSVTTIPARMFIGCTAIEEITLPDTIKNIGEAAFSGCTALKLFVFGSGVNTVSGEGGTGILVSTSALKIVDLSKTALDCKDNSLGVYQTTGVIFYVPNSVSAENLKGAITNNGGNSNSNYYAIPNGGSFSKYATSSVTLETPTKEGYTFGGWYYTDPTTSAETKLIGSPVAGTVYYAKWIGTVKFDGNEAESGSMVEQVIDGSATLNPNNFVRDHYTFTGWNTVKDNSSSTTFYKDGATVDFTKNTTLYAQWEIDKYPITWKNSDGEVLKTENIAYGDTPEYGGIVPTKEADTNWYVFNGWYPTVETVKGEKTYTATYTEIPMNDETRDEEKPLLVISIVKANDVTNLTTVGNHKFTILDGGDSASIKDENGVVTLIVKFDSNVGTAGESETSVNGKIQKITAQYGEATTTIAGVGEIKSSVSLGLKELISNLPKIESDIKENHAKTIEASYPNLKPLGMVTADGSGIKTYLEGDKVTIVFTFASGMVDTSKLWHFHITDSGLAVPKKITNIAEANGIVTAIITVDGFSTHGIAVGDLSQPENKPSSSTPQGSVVWLTETPTPTPTETVTPVPTEIQPTQTQTEAESPLSVLGILAGLGAVAVLRRR